MGKLTQISYEYPDVVLTATGAVGGFLLGSALEGVTAGAVGVILGIVFTTLIGSLTPKEPVYGPHQ